MKKKFAAISAAAVIMAHTVIMPRAAAEEVIEYDYPKLEYQDTSTAACWLNTGGRRLICISDISARKETKRITLTQYLEVQSGKRWKIVSAWCSISNKSYLTVKKEKAVTCGGVYRLRSVFKVYDSRNRNTDTVTVNSNNKLVK